MRLFWKKLALVIAACGLVAVAFSAPAAGQIDPGEMSDLESRRDEIVALLAELDARVEELTTTVADVNGSIEIAEVEVELVADELEVAVDARHEPARTRIQVAIAGFVGGDPRRSALIDEMEAVQGSTEPTLRREMYGAVIDESVTRLAEIDDRLVELSQTMTDRRGDLSAVEEQLAAVEQELTEAGAARTAFALELDDVRSRIDELADLANRNVLTGLTSFDDPTRPALAVKIDNVRAARPQSGINQADIVYVEEVEGGFTRLLAVFHSTGAEIIGPIRSMRTSDFRILPPYNSPLFATSGGNRAAVGGLANTTIIDIGAHTLPEGYYRDSGRSRPHNLMANTFDLWVRGGFFPANTPSPLFSFRDDGSPGPGARAVAGVTIDYGSAESRYEWNGSGWARFQDGEPMVDTTGAQVAPTTLIVQESEYIASRADAASPEAITIGSGPALIFSEGQVVEATWRRAGLNDRTEYVDGSGNPLSIRRGRTWIELPRANRTVVN